MKEQPDNRRITLGLLITFENSRSFEVWQGAVDAANSHNVTLVCFPSGLLGSKEHFLQNPRRVLCDLIGQSSLNGLLTFQWWGSQTWFEEAIGHFHLPLLTIMRQYPGYQSVMTDDYHGMQALMQHLIEVHGYRRIAYLGSSKDVSSEKVRYRAYLEALSSYNLAYEPRLVSTRSDTGFFNEARGQQGIEQLLDERGLLPGRDVEALVCFNDQMAFGALEELQKRGIRVPENLAVTGFDNSARTQVSTPPLTSVAFPWYEMGKQAVETLIGTLDGKMDAHQVLVPASPAVRRSCGCLESAVAKASEGIQIAESENYDESEDSRKVLLSAELAKILTGHLDEPSVWAQRLLEAVSSESAADSFSDFPEVLRECLYQLADHHDNIQAVGQEIISVLHRVLRVTCAHDTKGPQQLDLLWQQSRVLVGEIVQWSQGRRQLEEEQQAIALRELGQRLISTFHVDDLVDALAKGFPELGIPGAYLAVYEDPQAPASQSRLLLAYTAEQGRIDPDAGESIFPSPKLVPDGLLRRDQASSLVVEALFFGDEQLGFVVFEQGPKDGRIYEILRGEISSALQGALLFKRVQQHAAEIARQKYVLDTFMDTVPDWIYFKDREGRITQANSAYMRRFGIDDPAKLLGKTDFDFFPQELAQIKDEQEQSIFRTGEALLGLEELDQHNVWALTTKMPLRDEHGEIIGTFGFSRNITKLKQAEQELRQYRDHLEELVKERTTELRQANEALHAQMTERQRAEQALHVSEQQYRLLAENVKDGIVILQDDRVVFVNTAFAAMIQQNIDQLYISEAASLFPHLMICREQSQTASSPSALPCQEEFVNSAGETTWAEIEQSAILWNNQPAILLTVRNITHAKLREIRLEEERSRLHQENLTFKSTITERFRFGALVGKSSAMQRVYELIISAAAAEANVLIQGESGTGKELVADTIHQVSARKGRAFVAVNCASIPDTLFEREFFGHRKGAFTGADHDKPGFFDRAHRGILFLDEVTEMQPGTQAKLLRVLQNGDYLPLGDTLSKQADVMIVAASNKECRQEIEAGRLRQDFFYRIGVIRIDIPPLRERKEDLSLLLDHFLTQYRTKQQGQSAHSPRQIFQEPGELPAELLNAFHAYDWPGNVRELQNVLQHYLVTGDLKSTLNLIGAAQAARQGAEQIEIPSHENSLHAVVEQVERRMISTMLVKTDNNRRKTARLLGISRRTLYLKIEKFGLQEEKP